MNHSFLSTIVADHSASAILLPFTFAVPLYFHTLPWDLIASISKCKSQSGITGFLNFAFSIIYQKDYKKYNVDPEETDFLIDTVRLVKEANVALLLKEQQDGTFKGSLRSRNDFNVQELASIFNGGGHKAASGFSSNLSQTEIISTIENEIRTKL